MKKQVLLKSMLILLPILAVGLATTGDSVMVFDPQTGVMEHYSYFDLLPVGAYQMITPLAAVLCVAAGLVGAVYMVKSKAWCLKAVRYISFAAATLAVLPVLMQGDVMIVPNAGLPIFMLVDFCFALYLGKQEDVPAAQEPRKLKKH